MNGKKFCVPKAALMWYKKRNENKDTKRHAL
jgi:hypothetical protein